MAGFEGIGDFDSEDPYQRYLAHQAAKGNWPPARVIVDIPPKISRNENESGDDND